MRAHAEHRYVKQAPCAVPASTASAQGRNSFPSLRTGSREAQVGIARAMTATAGRTEIGRRR